MNIQAQRPKPCVLLILDGWGYREDPSNNAIGLARTPHWDHIWKTYPHTLLSASGRDVGLPDGQMGNSEVGHLNIGAGRIIPQDLTRLEDELANGAFFENPTLLNAVQQAAHANTAVHIMGLLSPGGVHSHENHLFACLKLAAQAGVTKLYLHGFLDGRDTPPKSALASLQKMEALFDELGVGKIASIIGRYYAMDRDNRWERVLPAYRLLSEGIGIFTAPTAELALAQAYSRNETDEFVQATAISDNPQPLRMEAGDVVIYMNYRSDRARALTSAFTALDFTGFPRPYTPKLQHFITLTQYSKNTNAEIAYPPLSYSQILGEVLQNQGLKQLRVAETEKYAHVTFFFNGGVEKPFQDETRILIPSPKAATYDLIPEMSADQVTDKLVENIINQKYDIIICNYANADMVGHTGNLTAAIEAIETLDVCLGKIMVALQQVHGEAFITADHGNAECMHDDINHQAHTAHTLSLVPFVYITEKNNITFKNTTGILADVAPTLLYTIGIKQPTEMTGHNLLLPVLTS